MDTVEITNGVVETAIIVATKAHYGASRWNGEPYILHPLRVMGKMKTNLGRAVAVLHDVIEDTKETAETLLKVHLIPLEVVRHVNRLSKPKGADYGVFISDMLVDPVAMAVKMQDLMDNLNIWDLTLTHDGQFITPKHSARMNKYLQALDTLRKHYPTQCVI